MSWNCSIGAIKEVGEASKRKLNPVLLNAMKYISSDAREYGQDNWDALEERQLILQKFRGINDLWEALGIAAIRPAKHCWWRLTPVIAGGIRGLPSMRGLLIASDGIICLCLRDNGSYFTGHLENFEPNEKLEMPGQDFDSYFGKARLGKSKNIGKKTKPKYDIEEFC